MLRKTVEGAAPASDRAAIQTARRQWRNLIAVKKARSKDAARSISILRLSGQNGSKELMDLVAAARQVLPDAFQNSGTAARIGELAAPAMIGGIAGGLLQGDLTAAGQGAMIGLAAPYAGQALLRSPATNYLAQGLAPGAVRNALTSPVTRGALAQTPIAYFLSEPARQ